MFNDLQLPGGKAGLLKEPRSNCQERCSGGAAVRRGWRGGGGKLDRERVRTEAGWMLFLSYPSPRS